VHKYGHAQRREAGQKPWREEAHQLRSFLSAR
jgi:hypothetical protein